MLLPIAMLALNFDLACVDRDQAQRCINAAHSDDAQPCKDDRERVVCAVTT